MAMMRFPGGLGKALTLSYDDGVEQDERLIQILDAHGLKCTFNLNSGCYAPEGTVWPAGTIHRRLPHSRIKELYSGKQHEVAVHCLTHANLEELPSDQVVYEVMTDRINLEQDFGPIVRGMAYPFGTYNDEVVAALKACGIQYARTVESSHSFAVPQDWLRLKPTCHHNDPMLDELCDSFLTANTKFSCKVFYVWGHAYEFEANDNWQRMEAFCDKMAGHADTWYCTNIELCEYVKAYQSLVFSADGKHIYNPTAQTVWLQQDRTIHAVKPGEVIEV